MVGGNHNSCDSIVTLNLTINHATYGDTTAVECESFSWHGVTYTETPVTAPTYTMVGSNHNGCDSIVTLHLTVNHSNTGIDEQTACDSYVWIDGNAYTASNNTATFTLTNAAGCDSTVTLHLTVNHSTTSVTSVTACDSFEWNGQTYTSSGIYNYQTTNAAGCDSVMTLHLIVNTTGSTQVFDTICEGEVYPFFGQLLYSTGVYTDTLFSSKGCDSVITLNLTVNPLPHVSISGDTSICQGQTTTLSASGGGSYLWSNTSTQTNISVSQSGTYTVTVTNTYRCSATSSVIVTVNPLPNVIISGDTTFCQGSSTTLTANGALNYTWNNASTNPSITVSNADTYTVTGTDTNDCSNTANKTVSVNPTYNITVYDSICQGGSYNFFGQNLTTADTYSHTLYTSKGCDSVITLVLTVNPLPSVTISDSSHFCQGDSLTLTAIGENIDTYVWSTGDTSASKIVNAAGKYTVTATNTNGCTASAEKSITTDPLPVISITGNVSFCADSSTTLTASGASTYVWSSGVYTDSITVNSAGQYTVTGTDDNGCRGTASVMTFVKPLPIPVITGPSAICAGDTATLTAIGGNTYHWSTGSTQNTISVTQSDTYTVTATSAENCSATATITVTEYALPTVVINGNTTFCTGSSTTLIALGQSTDTYLWSTGESSDSIIVNAAGTYMVTATNTYGCTASASQTVTTDTLPVISIGGNDSFCDGSSTTLTASGASTYVWSSGVYTDSITVNSAGQYTVTGTDNNGCAGSATIMTFVKPLPTPVITGPSTICQGDTATLAAIGGNTYHWSNGSTQNSISVSQNGTYTVTATSAENCFATADFTLTVNSLPNVTISGNTTFCQGTTTTLNAAGANTYTWSGGVNSESIIISSAGSYTVTGTDANGCSNTASETVTMNLTYNTPLTASICQGESYDFYGQPLDTTGVYTHTLQTVHGCDSIITLTLTVNQLPKPIITGDLTICPEEETTLIAGGGAQYDWSTGATTNQITVQDTGVYSVTVTDSYGCQASAAVTVSYDSTALTKKAIVCKRKADGTPRMLLYPDPDLQYQWYHNGTAMNGENKQYYAPDAGFAMDGSCYTVRVKPVGSDDCGFVTLPWCYTSNTTAKLSILPNPNDGRFRLLLPDDAINVRIYNANGQLVLDRETDGEVELTISADLANGFYMVKVQRENGETNTEKLVINR